MAHEDLIINNNNDKRFQYNHLLYPSYHKVIGLEEGFFETFYASSGLLYELVSYSTVLHQVEKRSASVSLT